MIFFSSGKFFIKLLKQSDLTLPKQKIKLFNPTYSTLLFPKLKKFFPYLKKLKLN